MKSDLVGASMSVSRMRGANETQAAALEGVMRTPNDI